MACTKMTLHGGTALEAANTAARVWQLQGYRLEIGATTWGEEFTATTLMPGENDDGDSEVMYGYAERGDSRWYIRRGA